METIAASTVAEPQPAPVVPVVPAVPILTAPEDDPTAAERRELLREELRAAIHRKVAGPRL